MTIGGTSTTKTGRRTAAPTTVCGDDVHNTIPSVQASGSGVYAYRTETHPDATDPPCETTLGPNAHFPAELQQPAAYVTVEDPWTGEFSKDLRYIHTNQRRDHRFNRAADPYVGTERRRIPSVSEYVAAHVHDDVFDVHRIDLMVGRPENADLVEDERRADRNTREGAWAEMWRHLGRHVTYGEYFPPPPTDTAYLRHPSERRYTQEMAITMRNIMEQETYRAGYNDVTASNLPRPITTYYMFQVYHEWVEDGGFEKRHRLATTEGGRPQTPLYVSWSNTNL